MGNDLLMFLLGGTYFLPCALAAGTAANLAIRRRSMLLVALAMPILWVMTGALLFALTLYRPADIPAGDLRLLQVILGAIVPVYGLALLMALLVVHFRLRPFTGAVLTTAAGAIGCIFVVPAFIVGNCSTFGLCP